MHYVCNACKYISEDEVMCIILIGSPVPGVQANSSKIQIQPGMHACRYVSICTCVYIYVYIYIYYIRARDDCNRHLQHVKSIRKGYTCAQKHSFHCHQTGFVLFQTPRFQEVFGSQRTLFRSVSGYSPAVCSPKQRTEPDEPNFPGFLLSCITAVLEFTNPTELEHKKRMAEIKEPRILVGAKGLGTKWAGFLRRCLKVVNLETSKKSLPTTQNWEVLYITNGSVKIIEQKSQKVEVVFRIGAVTFSGSGCVYESSCAVVSPVEGWFSKKTGSENGHDIFTLSNCQIVTLTWICTSASLGIRTKKHVGTRDPVWEVGGGGVDSWATLWIRWLSVWIYGPRGAQINLGSAAL